MSASAAAAIVMVIDIIVFASSVLGLVAFEFEHEHSAFAPIAAQTTIGTIPSTICDFVAMFENGVCDSRAVPRF